MKKSLFFLFLFVALFLSAQWTDDLSMNTVIASDSQDQEFNDYLDMPADYTVVEIPAGTVIVWDDENGNGYDIRAQLIDEMGYFQWGANGVAVCVDAGDQKLPSVVADGDDGVLVFWQDEGGLDRDIYAQKINSSGALVWGSKLAIDSSVGNQIYPVACSDGAGGAFIAYSHYNGSDYDIYAERVASDGTEYWNYAICTASQHQLYPVVLPDGSGGAVMAWEDNRSPALLTDIYGQKIDENGTIMWTPTGLPIAVASQDQDDPVIASDELGGMYITWNDYRDGRHYDVFLQRVYSDGSMWSSKADIGDGGADDFWPALDNNGSEGAFISWWEDMGSSGDDINVTYVLSDGTIVFETGVVTDTADRTSPALTCDDNGNAYISFGDQRDGSAVVWMQKMDTTGTKLWTDDGVATNTGTNPGANSFMHITDNEYVICFWEVGNNEDIYCQAFTDQGNAPNSERNAVSSTGLYFYFDVGIELDFDSVSGSGNVDIALAQEQITGVGITNPASAWWRIEEEAGITGFTTDIVFDYSPYQAEFDENLLKIFVNEGAGWLEYPNFTIDTVGKTITALGATDFSDWTLGEDIDDPLPVTLSSFTATLNVNDDVELQWVVESETGIVGYNIYRNEEEELEYSDCMNNLILPATNNSQVHEYSYVDIEAEEGYTYNYWLQSVEIDGTTTFYGPVMITIASEDEGEEVETPTLKNDLISIYPNPFNPTTTVLFSLKEIGDVKIDMYNLKGQLVKTQLLANQDGGNHAYRLDAISDNGSKLSSGVYQLKVTMDGETFSSKVVLLK